MDLAPPRAIPRSRRRAFLLGALVLALSAGLLYLSPQIQRLGNLGYPGVFLVTLLASGALVLPIPYLAAIFVVARSLDPVAVALIAGLASALGELTGYALGASGRQLLDDRGWITRLARWRGRRGVLAVLAASIIPNPAFDAVGMAAGATGLPTWQFFLAAFTGKTLRFLVITLVGHQFFSP